MRCLICVSKVVSFLHLYNIIGHSALTLQMVVALNVSMNQFGERHILQCHLNWDSNISRTLVKQINETSHISRLDKYFKQINIYQSYVVEW